MGDEDVCLKFNVFITRDGIEFTPITCNLNSNTAKI